VPPPEVDVRKSLMLLVNSHILKMVAMLKPNAEYNWRAAIIEDFCVGLSAIIRFFGFEINRLWRCGKIYGFRTVQGSSKLIWKNALRGPLQSWKGSSADFGWPKAIVTKISIDCWCKRANNASNCRGRPSIQIVYIKDTTDALICCQDKPSCSHSGFPAQI